MNKYENINLEKSCPLNKVVIDNDKKANNHMRRILTKIDLHKCVYLKFRNKNNIDEFNDCCESEENDIIVYDNIINKNIIENIYKYIFKFNWRLMHTNPQKNKGIMFSSQLYDNIYFEKMFYDLIIPNIDYINKEKIKILHIHMNLNFSLHPGYWHLDSPGLGPTILVYTNPNWKKEWGGQTAFYTNTKTKEIKYIDAVPGRIVIFKPYITHRGCDESIFSVKEGNYRFSLAFKTYYEQ